MAGPGGNEVGRVSIRVVPNTDHFYRELKAKLEALEKSLEAQIPVELDEDGVVAHMRGLLLRLKAQARAARVQVPVDVDRRGLGGFINQGRNGLAALSKALTQTGNSAGFARKRFLGLTRVGWIMTAVFTLATPALGLIVGLLASLPVLMSAVGAAAAAIYLGWDGIKRAAQQLSPEIDHLKKVMSARFEERLTPQFARLKPVLVAIEDEMLSVADGLSDMFTGFVDVVSSGKGLTQLQNIIGKTGQFLSDMTPTVENFTRSFLTLGESGANNFHYLASALETFSGRFDAMVTKLASNGTLDRMFEGFSQTFVGLGDLFNGLFEAGAHAMAELGDNMGRFLSSLGTLAVDIEPFLSTLSSFTLDNLSYLAEKLGPSLKDATPTLREFLDAVDPLVKKVIDLGIAFIDSLVPALEKATPAIEKIAGALASFGDELEGTMTWLGPLIAGMWLASKTLKIFSGLLKKVPGGGRILGLVGIFALLDAGIRSVGLSWGDLTAKFLNPIEHIKTVFAGAGEAWRNLTGSGFLDIGAQLDKMNLGLASWQEAWNGFVNGLKVAWQGFLDFINWDILVMGATTAWNTIANGFQGALNAIDPSLALAGLQTVWDSIVNTFDWGLLVDGARNAFSGLVGVWQGTSGVLLGAISGFIGQVIGLWQTLGPAIGAAASAAWAAVSGAFTSGVATCVGIITTLPGRCVSALGNVGSMLVASGRSLVEGFAAGIRAGIGSAVSAAGEVVSAVRNLFPFSPAKEGPFSGKGWVLYSGISIGDAFAAGIRVRIPDVRSAAQDMTAAAHAAFDRTVDGITDRVNTGMNKAIDATKGKANELGEAAGIEGLGDRWESVLLDSGKVITDQLGKLPGHVDSIVSQINDALVNGIDLTRLGEKFRNQIVDNIEKQRDDLIKTAKDTTNKLGDDAGVEKLGDRWESVLTDSFKVFEHQMGKVPEMWQKAMEEANLADVPSNFAKATGDQFLQDLGIDGSGALPQLVKQVSEFHYHVSNVEEAQQLQKNQQAKDALQYTRR